MTVGILRAVGRIKTKVLIYIRRERGMGGKDEFAGNVAVQALET